MPGEKDVTISDNTKIKLGVAVAAMAAILTLGTVIWSLKSDVMEIKSNRWTIAQECEAALRTAILNPGIKMPDPRSPGSVIEVMSAHVDAKPRQQHTTKGTQ